MNILCCCKIKVEKPFSKFPFCAIVLHMNEYIVPLTSLMISFISVYLCIKFIFSRQGFFWILPSALSVLIAAYMLNLLLVPSYKLAIPFQIPLFPLIVSIGWLIVVVQFRYSIKKSVDVNRFEDERRKNYTEAKFIEKSERRSFLRFQHRKMQESANSAFVPELYSRREDSLSIYD